MQRDDFTVGRNGDGSDFTVHQNDQKPDKDPKKPKQQKPDANPKKGDKQKTSNGPKKHER